LRGGDMTRALSQSGGRAHCSLARQTKWQTISNATAIIASTTASSTLAWCSGTGLRSRWPLGAIPELQLRCAVKAEPMTLAVPTTSISSCLRLRCGAHGVFPKSAAGFLCPMQQPAECAGQKLTVAGDEIADGRAGLCESGTGAAQRCLRVG
jgi:hypothetical protein